MSEARVTTTPGKHILIVSVLVRFVVAYLNGLIQRGVEVPSIDSYSVLYFCLRDIYKSRESWIKERERYYLYFHRLQVSPRCFLLMPVGFFLRWMHEASKIGKALHNKLGKTLRSTHCR